MKNEKFLILGGTGKTGRRIVERLQNQGLDVRVGSRSASPGFDWSNPDTWSVALDGIDKVYITYQPDLAVPGAYDTVKAFSAKAVEAGVQKLVLLSGKGEQEAELSEQIVMQSGVNWTIIRASWFNQNFSESFFLDPVLNGVVALPKADALVPYVDANDIAEVAVEVLLNDKHNEKMYELTGPRQLTFPQVVQEIAQASGRNIAFIPISLEEYEAGMKQAGLPNDYVWLVSYLFREVLTESNSIITNDIEKVLGRKPIDFSEYAQQTAATNIWQPKATMV